MVEASDFANRDDLAEFRPLNWAGVTVSTVLNEAVAPPVCLATHSCRHALISELARGTQSPLRSTRNAFHSVTYSRVDTTRAPISAQIHGR